MVSNIATNCSQCLVPNLTSGVYATDFYSQVHNTKCVYLQISKYTQYMNDMICIKKEIKLVLFQQQ